MTDIEENLFNEYWKIFNNAIDKGFGDPEPDTSDYSFVADLKANNAVFAAFKVHRAQNDMAALMFDDKGELKPFSKWVKEAMPIADHQNKTWLQTEYNTAVKRSHQAAQWRQFIREADILPNLRWMPSSAIHPREGHMIFWNRIWAINDNFWNTHRPGDEWGCLCDLTSTDDPVTDNSDLTPILIKPSPGLDNNPAIDGKIFSDSHPYVRNAYKGAEKAVNRFLKEKLDHLSISFFKIAKKYKNGGSLQIHNLVERNKSDYKDLYTIANLFAREGSEVKLTPNVHFKSADYSDIYAELLGTPYYRKCPDLSIDGVFYEYESFLRPWKKRKVGDMLKHGLKQSSRIIIDNNAGCGDRYIKRLITIQSQQVSIDEVWVYEKGKLRLLYKKQGD